MENEIKILESLIRTAELVIDCKKGKKSMFDKGVTSANQAMVETYKRLIDKIKRENESQSS